MQRRVDDVGSGGGGNRLLQRVVSDEQRKFGAGGRRDQHTAGEANPALVDGAHRRWVVRLVHRDCNGPARRHKVCHDAVQLPPAVGRQACHQQGRVGRAST